MSTQTKTKVYHHDHVNYKVVPWVTSLNCTIVTIFLMFNNWILHLTFTLALIQNVENHTPTNTDTDTDTPTKPDTDTDTPRL